MYKRQKLDPNREAAKQLEKQGFLVLQIPGVKVSVEDWDRVIQLMPEFKTETTRFVGGCGLLANPSSFHNSLVRRLRIEIFESAREIFTALAEHLGFDRIELLIGQMLQRMPGQAPQKEFYREQPLSRNLEQGDLVLSGWFNVEDTPQTFCYCPSSHLDGVNTYSESRVIVPPKHVVIFYSSLVQNFMSKAARQRALFLGWRLTNGNLAFVPNIKDLLVTQSVIPLKSGRLPEMWPQSYWYDRPELLRLSTNFAFFLQTETAVNAVLSVRHVFRFCPSLSQLGFPLYSRYTSEETEMYKPFLL